MHHKEDRNRLPSPTTNDFCSALALDACCMQRPMKRKVRWFVFFSVLFWLDLFLFPRGTLSHMNHSKCVHLFVSPLPLEGKAEFYPVALSLFVSRQRRRGGTRGWEERIRNADSWLRTPLLISASSLFCMNVSCQWTREIKMVVCISCWVAVALPAFSSRAVCCFLFCCCCFFSVRVP